jgi:hypothetical protein
MTNLGRWAVAAAGLGGWLSVQAGAVDKSQIGRLPSHAQLPQPDLQCTISAYNESDPVGQWPIGPYIPMRAQATTVAVWVMVSGKNMGTALANNATARITASQGVPQSVNVAGATIAVSAVHNYPLQKFVFSKGQVKVTAVMDPANAIAESAENNNTCEMALWIGMTP